jgi:hypothetical protein
MKNVSLAIPTSTSVAFCHSNWSLRLTLYTTSIDLIKSVSKGKVPAFHPPGTSPFPNNQFSFLGINIRALNIKISNYVHGPEFL